MDPITHAFLGAAVALTTLPVFRPAALGQDQARGATGEPSAWRIGWKLALLGAAAGTLADADVFFRVWSDPALPWEVHRQLTHALAFAPVGGLIALLPFVLFRFWREHLKPAAAAAILAYASHGLLDACTSYGTSLWLPFSKSRSAWDLIAIIDPVFSVCLVIGVILAARRARPAPAFCALLLGAAYLGLGARQHAVAMHEIARRAAERGDAIERARALPTPANLVIWRGLYVSEGRIHADGVRVPILGAARWRPGTSVPLFQAGAPGTAADAREARIADVEARFQRFADGFAARDPQQPEVLADMRYSLEVAAFAPLWGIRIRDDHEGDPVSWVDLTDTDERASVRNIWRDLRQR
ncbi:MAG TPA: metal-dependent hydrolase [Candidatus Polarisedimenticolia bacterium]|nr:metal-dependent hydrolase [Candidatus Polarisedimenticolia bacterium]